MAYKHFFGVDHSCVKPFCSGEKNLSHFLFSGIAHTSSSKLNSASNFSNNACGVAQRSLTLLAVVIQSSIRSSQCRHAYASSGCARRTVLCVGPASGLCRPPVQRGIPSALTAYELHGVHTLGLW